MHVVLNMACSVDGRVAGPGGQPVKLSGPEDTARVHRLRATSDAVLVGIGTVLADDPHLTARGDPRPPVEEQPVRVAVDSRARTPPDARVLDDEAPTILLTAEDAEIDGAEVLRANGGDRVDLAEGLALLADRGIERVLVEGGPTLAASLLDAGLADRLHLYLAPHVLGEGPSLAEALEGVGAELRPRTRGPLGEGTLVSYGVGP